MRGMTCSNLRRMMLLFGKVRIEDIHDKDIYDFKYANISYANEWKVEMVKEIIEIMNDNLVVDNFEDENLQEILDYLCTSNTFLPSKHHICKPFL